MSACGSGAGGTQPVPVEAPPAPAAIAVPAVPDAVPRLLACEPGTTPVADAPPEPTWACARPDGTRHGPYVTLFPDASVAIRGTYRDGALDGDWQRLHPGGALAEHGAYVAGSKDGAWQRLGPSGTVLGEYTLTAGTGVETEWLDPPAPPFGGASPRGDAGTRYRETHYTDGVRDGVAQTFSPEGTVWARSTWKAGTLDGVRATGTTSTVRIEETFAEGIRIGKRRVFLQGVKIVEDHFDGQGRLHGAYTLWRAPNLVRTQGTYQHGKRVGRWVWTDKFKSVEREGTYKAGKREGPWIERDRGKTTFTGTYLRGQPDGVFVHFDRKGDELGRSTIKAGAGVMQTFHPNGTVWTETTLAGGIANGRYRERTPRGRVVAEGAYRSGAKHGPWKEWTATGTIVLDEHFDHGRLDGTVKKYVGGTLASEATFASGKAHGPYVELRAGTPAVTGQFVDDRRDGTWTLRRADGTATIVTYRLGILAPP